MNFFGHALVAARRRDDPAWLVGAMAPDLAHMAGLRLRPDGAVQALDGESANVGWSANVGESANDLLAAGVRFHHATDDAFHGAPAFLALLATAKADLLARGLGPGPAAALAHVGTELLLDGALAARRGVPASFRAALAQAPELGPRLPLRAPAGAPANAPADAPRAASSGGPEEAAVGSPTGGQAGAPVCAAAGATGEAPDDAPSRWRSLCVRLAAAPVPEAYGDPAFVAERLVRLLAARPRLAVPPDLAPEVTAWAAAARAGVAGAAEALLAQVEARLAAAGQGVAAGPPSAAPAQEVA